MLDELLIKEWNYNKNEISPEKYMQYSNKKVSKHVIAGYWENWVDNEFNGKKPQ